MNSHDFVKCSLLALLLMVGAFGCASRSPAPLPVVTEFDTARYLGTWYEIASIPNRFQAGCVATEANYAAKANGELVIKNRCRNERLDGPVREATGRAWAPDPQKPAQLKVEFFWPFKGDYWVMALEPEYRYALIGTPHRKYLWILSRTRTLPRETTERLLSLAREYGFDTDKAQYTLQPEGPQKVASTALSH